MAESAPHCSSSGGGGEPDPDSTHLPPPGSSRSATHHTLFSWGYLFCGRSRSSLKWRRERCQVRCPHPPMNHRSAADPPAPPPAALRDGSAGSELWHSTQSSPRTAQHTPNYPCLGCAVEMIKLSIFYYSLLLLVLVLYVTCN